jgi:hypothetical protein
MSATVHVLPPGAARTPEEVDLDVRALMGVLLPAQVGDLVTYAALAAAIGAGVQSGQPGYHALGRARARLIEEHGYLFEARPNEGLVRQGATGEALHHVQRRHRRARRQFLKSRKVLAYVVAEADLTDGERLRFHTLQTLNELLAQKIRPAALRQLEAEVANAKAAIPPAKALEAFLKA